MHRKEACLRHIQQIHYQSVQGFDSASAPLLVLQSGQKAAVQRCLQPLQLRLALIRLLWLQGMSAGDAPSNFHAHAPERQRRCACRGMIAYFSRHGVMLRLISETQG